MNVQMKIRNVMTASIAPTMQDPLLVWTAIELARNAPLLVQRNAPRVTLASS